MNAIERKIEKLLIETEYKMTDDQKFQAGEESRKAELNKLAEKNTAEEMAKQKEFDAQVEAQDNQIPEMGDGSGVPTSLLKAFVDSTN
jgi:hypothetical protein